MLLVGVIAALLFFSLLHIIFKALDDADQKRRADKVQKWIDEGNLDRQLREVWDRDARP
jgi:hypothetical protein